MKPTPGKRGFARKVFLFFLPLSVAASVITGLGSYSSAKEELKSNTYSLVSDTVDQVVLYLNDKMGTALEQYQFIENNPAFLRMMLEEKARKNYFYQDMISVIKSFHSASDDYGAIVDSVYFRDNSGLELYSMKSGVLRGIGRDVPGLNLGEPSVNGELVWVNSHTDQIFDTAEKRNVISIYKKYGTENSKINFCLVLNMKSSYFLDVLDHVNLGNAGYLMLVDQKSELYSSSFSGEYRLNQSDLDRLRGGGLAGDWLTMNSENGEKMMVTCGVLTTNGWTVAAVIPERQIVEKADIVFNNTMQLVMIMVVICLCVSLFLSHTISNPISALTQQVRRVEEGDMNTVFDVKAKNEISVLVDGMNRLVARVRQLLLEVTEKEKQKRISELAVIQAQINPHFLYNTLASIRTLVELEERGKAVHMIDSLILFFKTGLSRGQTVIPLEKELEHVSSYLKIQKMRYSHDFEYEFQISDGVAQAGIVKISLQPLVENCLYHGIKGREAGGMILISACREEDSLVVRVFDNGYGIAPQKLLELEDCIGQRFGETNPKMTFGLRNVHQRILLRYGEPYGLTVESVVDEYTQITLKVPFQSCEEGGVQA